jgi:chromosomal replication initiation ATPase DnaA
MTPSDLCNAAEKAAPGQSLDLLLAAVKVAAGRQQAKKVYRSYRGITPTDVLCAVSQRLQLPEHHIRGRSKDAMSSKARQIAWVVIYDRCEGTTLAEIGALYGRNGETVASGIARARERYQETVRDVEVLLGLHAAEAAE